MQTVKNKILEAQSIAILAHDREDADAAGSSFAMRLALKSIGKNAECIFSDTLEQHLEFMDKDYSVFSGDAKEYDLCLCLDCGDIKRIGKRCAVFEKAKSTACIDHHETNTHFSDADYVDADAPATGEILYELFLDMGIEITREIAKNLYTAISADTCSFKYSNVRPRTMEIAARLLETGIDHAEIARKLYDTEPLNILKFKARVIDSIERYSDGKLNIISVTEDMLNQFGIAEKDTGDIVNIARSVEGCEIAVSIREADSKIKVSFRSNGRYTVSDLAEQFGGGGHLMAAGAAVSGLSLDEVKAKVIKICEEALNG